MKVSELRDFFNDMPSRLDNCEVMFNLIDENDRHYFEHKSFKVEDVDAEPMKNKVFLYEHKLCRPKNACLSKSRSTAKENPCSEIHLDGPNEESLRPFLVSLELTKDNDLHTAVEELTLDDSFVNTNVWLNKRFDDMQKQIDEMKTKLFANDEKKVWNKVDSSAFNTLPRIDDLIIVKDKSQFAYISRVKFDGFGTQPYVINPVTLKRYYLVDDVEWICVNELF